MDLCLAIMVILMVKLIVEKLDVKNLEKERVDYEKKINAKVTIVYDNKTFYDDNTIKNIIKSIIANSLFKITLNKDIVIYKINITNNEE